MPRPKKAANAIKATPRANRADVRSYDHPEATAKLRPEAGMEAQFRKRKEPTRFRYDSSLSPALDWDGGNGARELGEWLLAMIEEASARPDGAFDKPREFKGNDGQVIARVANLREAVAELRRLSKPFLNWAGKAERLSFDVPALPLFKHEYLSTEHILSTLKGHERDKRIAFDFADYTPRPLADVATRAYEQSDTWENRMILGDSLVVMNSLLRYDGLGGQVQMIYMDPPYGVKFGSNFQPFVRKRDVKHNDDDDFTREPEMVQAYRDTWELGLHSYLAYLRDRFTLARDLLHPSGSIFVQISDENVHHVREVMDEVFGAENFVSLIPFRKKTMPLGTVFIEQMSDFILWYAKRAYDEHGRRFAKYKALYLERSVEGEFHHVWYQLPDGSRHRMTRFQMYDHSLLPSGARVYRLKSLEPSGPMQSGMFDYEFEGKIYPHPKNGYATTPEGMDRLVAAKRIQPEGNRLSYILFADESDATKLTVPWTNTVGADDKSYAVQTNTEVVRRCVLMTTDPGDLVLDPTCGSGSTADVAEQWGRRWITCDVSRVPLALSRQRLLTATYPWYELQDEARGPSGGFVYKRRQNNKGEEVGGILPRITLGSIANNELPEPVTLWDRPEVNAKITRVCGPFAFEATIPRPADLDEAETAPRAELPEQYGSFVERMIEVLRRAPVVQVGEGKTATFKSIRRPAKTLALSAEAVVPNGTEKPVALVFGPENGAVSERTVSEAAREAYQKGYAHLYVVGFAIQPNARDFIEKAEAISGVPATYLQATPDLMMGDLLKNMRSSQIFSVCGLPDISLKHVEGQPELGLYQVELLGLDVFDPITMQTTHRPGNDVPMWMLDTNYNGRCFIISQAFFPRTSAWSDIQRSLKGVYDDAVWEHLSGVTSEPFEAGSEEQIAVKVIDDRGNELLVVKKLSDAS